MEIIVFWFNFPWNVFQRVQLKICQYWFLQWCATKPSLEAMMAYFTDTCMHPWINTLRPRQNGCHFPYDILKYTFLNENVWILIKISLKFVPKGPHYSDVIMGVMGTQITSIMIVNLAVYSGADQQIYQSSASLPFVRGFRRWPVNSPHKEPITRKMYPFDDIIMNWQ